MKKFLFAIAMSAIATSAHAIDSVGIFNGTGFLIKRVSPTQYTDPPVLNVSAISVDPVGRVIAFDVRVDCSAPGQISIIPADKPSAVRNINYSDRKKHIAAVPERAGYFAIYDRVCPTKIANKPQKKNAQKCMMTDSGKLCGKELRDYQEND